MALQKLNIQTNTEAVYCQWHMRIQTFAADLASYTVNGKERMELKKEHMHYAQVATSTIAIEC